MEAVVKKWGGELGQRVMPLTCAFTLNGCGNLCESGEALK